MRSQMTEASETPAYYDIATERVGQSLAGGGPVDDPAHRLTPASTGHQVTGLTPAGPGHPDAGGRHCLAIAIRRRSSGSMKWSWLSSPRSICTQLILPVNRLLLAV